MPALLVQFQATYSSFKASTIALGRETQNSKLGIALGTVRTRTLLCASRPLLHGAPRRYRPDHLDLAAAHAHKLVEQVDDRAAVVGDNRHALADRGLVCAGPEIHMAMLLGH